MADLNKSWKERKSKLKNFSKKEILIIASILEKESCANERKKYLELFTTDLKIICFFKWIQQQYMV